MVKGAKNVVFGGEGLFMTTLRGPGTVWLQGMPPDRMVSEIMRRLPPGGGIGLGIPIGVGGGGGEAGEGVEGGADEVAGGAAEQVAATDSAVDADRQATVASSDVNPDSPEALFGDAAAPEDTSKSATTDASSSDDTFADESSWNETQSSQNETTFTDEGFGDEESFSTEDSFQEDTFGDDTSFSTFEESSSSMADAASDAASDDGGGVGSVLSTLWDLFTGGGD